MTKIYWYVIATLVFWLLVGFSVAAFGKDLSCPKVKIENTKNLKWNATDDAGARTAAKGCAKWFSKSPCLVRFIKRDVNTYHAVCGATR
jgi:hypothetical protein